MINSKSISIPSLLVGLVVGIALGFYVPKFIHNGSEEMTMDGMHDMATDTQMTTTSPVKQNTMTHTMSGSANPYMMGRVTSEKQFLRDMKLHHEAAVVMANQVLLIKTIHPEVRVLAKNIIDTQSTEIKMMKDWITSWGY